MVGGGFGSAGFPLGGSIVWENISVNLSTTSAIEMLRFLAIAGNSDVGLKGLWRVLTFVQGCPDLASVLRDSLLTVATAAVQSVPCDGGVVLRIFAMQSSILGHLFVGRFFGHAVPVLLIQATSSLDPVCKSEGRQALSPPSLMSLWPSRGMECMDPRRCSQEQFGICPSL